MDVPGRTVEHDQTHPHDGYAYDGCKCICCMNVRVLQTPRAEAAIPDSRLRAALTEIAKDDDLFVASGGAWGQQAYERRRDIARAALSPEGRQEPPDDAMYDDGEEPVR